MRGLDQVNKSFLMLYWSKGEIQEWLSLFKKFFIHVNYKIGTTVVMQIDDGKGFSYKLTSAQMDDKQKNYGIELIKEGNTEETKENKFYLAILPDSVCFRSRQKVDLDNILGCIEEKKIKYIKTDQGYDRSLYEKVTYNQTDDENAIVNKETFKKSTYLIEQDKVVEWSKQGETVFHSSTLGDFRQNYMYTRQDEDPSLVMVVKDEDEFVSKVTDALIPRYSELLTTKVKTETKNVNTNPSFQKQKK